MPAGQPNLIWQMGLEQKCLLVLIKVQLDSLDVQMIHTGMKITPGLLDLVLFQVTLPMLEIVLVLMIVCFILMGNLHLTGSSRWVRSMMQDTWQLAPVLPREKNIIGKHIILLVTQVLFLSLENQVFLTSLYQIHLPMVLNR